MDDDVTGSDGTLLLDEIRIYAPNASIGTPGEGHTMSVTSSLSTFPGEGPQADGLVYSTGIDDQLPVGNTA